MKEISGPGSRGRNLFLKIEICAAWAAATWAAGAACAAGAGDCAAGCGAACGGDVCAYCFLVTSKNMI